MPSQLPSASEPRFIVTGVFDSEARQHVLAAFAEEAAREHCRERNEEAGYKRFHTDRSLVVRSWNRMV